MSLSLVALTGCKGSKAEAEDEQGKREASTDSSSASKKKDDDKPKNVEKTPQGVKIEFTKPTGSVSKMTLTGMKAKGEVSCFDSTGCGVRITDLPEGTKAKLGGKEEVAKGKSPVRLDFDMNEQIGKASVEEALAYDKTVDAGLTLELTFPDDVKVSAALPGVTTKYFIEKTLEKELLNGRPVLWGKESEEAPKAHTILFLQSLLGKDNLIGPAKTMSEIDLVAVHEPQPKRDGNKTCTGYKATGDKGPGKDAKLMLVDWEVKLVERKTGKVVDTKKFEGEKRCPYVASGDEATSYPDRAPIQAWLRSKR